MSDADRSAGSLDGTVQPDSIQPSAAVDRVVRPDSGQPSGAGDRVMRPVPVQPSAAVDRVVQPESGQPSGAGSPAGENRTVVNLSKGAASHSIESQPPVEGQIVRPESPASQVSRTRRVLAAGATARDRGLQQLVALLVPLIRATRYPTLAVVLVAGIPAAAVILVSLLRWGPDDPFWLLLGGIGVVLAAWLAMRRRQLLAVAEDPVALTDALAGVITGREMWDQLARNVSARKVGAAVVRRSRPLRILGGLWRGVQMTGVLAQITDRPELQPLLPGRLRGMWFLGIACLIAGAVLTASVLVEVLLYLIGA